MTNPTRAGSYDPTPNTQLALAIRACILGCSFLCLSPSDCLSHEYNHLEPGSFLRLRHVGRRGAGRGARRPRRIGGGQGGEERLLAQLGMDEYYGSEGFDRPPSDVYDGAEA